MLSQGTRLTVPEQTGPYQHTHTHTDQKLLLTEDIKNVKKKCIRLVFYLPHTHSPAALSALFKDLKITGTPLITTQTNT